MKWMQSDHDKEMKFNRWFYYRDDEQTVVGSIAKVEPLPGYEAQQGSEVQEDEWHWEIFGEVDEQSAPKGYFDPYRADGYAPTMDEAKKRVAITIALDMRQ